MGVDNQSPEFLALNPLGKVPVLETPEGGIFESNAIARYVAGLKADTTLLGATYFESGQVLRRSPPRPPAPRAAAAARACRSCPQQRHPARRRRSSRLSLPPPLLAASRSQAV